MKRREKSPKQRRFLPGRIEIVHEDDDLIIVDKPRGINTVAVPGQMVRNVFGVLKDYVKSGSKRRGARVWILHRLDKEVSGLLVFAKTESAFRKLREDFRVKRMHRLYAAVVEGVIDRPGDTIRSYLYEDKQGLVHSVDDPAKAPPPRRRTGKEEDVGEVRPAVTHYRVLRTGRGRSLLEVRLETGRKHQIRVHMAGTGHPVVGDGRYGAASDPIGRVCLHAIELGFEHPVTGSSVRFHSKAPGAFRKLVGGAPGSLSADRERSSSPCPPSEEREPGALASSWDHVSAWYDQLLEDRGSDHYEQVIIPGALRLLEARPRERVLDVACGQGLFCRRLAALGVGVTGVDAAPRLIAAAQAADPAGRYLAGDVRALGALRIEPGFDAATCIMALMNIEPLAPVLEGVAALMRAGGRFVAVALHPAFRAPGQTRWQWEGPPVAPGQEPAATRPRGRRGRTTSRRRTAGGGPAEVRQYRRVDADLSPAPREIVMNPGAVASGALPVTTTTYHRPIGAYVKAFAAAGLRIDALVEWPSVRTSQSGPRAAEENRARREIPMFLALRGISPREGR